MIRKLQLSDHQTLKTWTQHFQPTPGFYWTPQELFDSWKVTDIWGSFEADHLIACLCLQPIGDSAEILWLATWPGKTRQGHMKGLLDNAKSHFTTLNLEVHQSNEGAQKLYLKAGFKEVYVRKNYYKDGGNAVLMTWTAGL